MGLAEGIIDDTCLVISTHLCPGLNYWNGIVFQMIKDVDMSDDFHRFKSKARDLLKEGEKTKYFLVQLAVERPMGRGRHGPSLAERSMRIFPEKSTVNSPHSEYSI